MKSNRGELRWFEKNSKKWNEDKWMKPQTSIFSQIFVRPKAVHCARCWNMPTNGPHEAYSLMGLGQRLMKRKLKYRLHNCLSMPQAHILFGSCICIKAQSMALGKRDMSRAGSSLCKIKGKGLGQKELKEGAWETGLPMIFQSTEKWKIMGIQASRAERTSMGRLPSQLDQRSIVLFYPNQHFSEERD